MAAEPQTMTLKTLGLAVSELAGDVRAYSKAEREALLTEAAARLVIASFLLERDPQERSTWPVPPENELRNVLLGAPSGDFSDIEATVSELEQRMHKGGDV